MKVLFEAINGKKGTKEFKSLKECKCFVLKNKKVIKEAQIMEGPLGSGSLNPIKAAKKVGKSVKNYMGNRKLANEPKDASNRSRLEVLNAVFNKMVRKEDLESMHDSKIAFDSNGFFIDINSWNYPLGDIKFNTGRTIKNVDGHDISIDAVSNKYGEKIPLPKLTLYIKKHAGKLPSENQIYNYFKDVVEKRYKVNLKKQLEKKPISHMSKTDVEDF